MPQKSDSTHTIISNELVLYKRERSSAWQCRYKVGSNKWQRKSTRTNDFKEAELKAKDKFYEARARVRLGEPEITRRFKDVANLAIRRMEEEQGVGEGKHSYKDYIRVINKYLIPYFRNTFITNIDQPKLNGFDKWRKEQMGKAPTKSTIQTHNAALNRVLDEAEIRNYLTNSNRPKIPKVKKSQGNQRAAFNKAETRKLLSSFDQWVDKAKNQKSRDLRALLKDYVYVLLDTGARPGNELMNLKWNHVEFDKNPEVIQTAEIDEDGEYIDSVDFNKSCISRIQF